MPHYEHLFTPIQIGNMTVPNRICHVPTDVSSSNADGSVSERDIHHHSQIAKGGAGLIIVGATSPDGKTGRPTVTGLVADSDSCIPGLARLAEGMHKYGAKCVVQLQHPGRQCAVPRYNTMSATDMVVKLPWSAGHEIVYENAEEKGKPVRAMTTEEVVDMVDKFSEAAWRVKQAGFDGVELHAAHGYLISQFMSPYLNKRIDRWGGSFENRMRFPLAIISSIQKKCGKNFPILVRYSADEWVEGGRELEESVRMAVEFERAGVAALDLSQCIQESPGAGFDPMYYPEGWTVYASQAVKKAVSIPVINSHTFRNPDYCDHLVESGDTDMIGLARQLLCDPYWPMKAYMGKPEQIRRCISCLTGCWQESMMAKKEIGCAINPACGHMEFDDLKPAAAPLKVGIVGGGPAGMEAARIATVRGHKVTLFEKTGELGGAILGCCMAPGKEKMKWYADWIRGQIKDLNVDVRLHTSPTVEQLKEFDVVLNATGAVSYVPECIGAERVVPFEEAIACPKVTCPFHPKDRKMRKTGEKVLVWGDHYAAADTAAALAGMGKDVTIVTDKKEFAASVEVIHMYVLRKRFAQTDAEALHSEPFKYPVKVYENSTVYSIEEGKVVLMDKNFQRTELAIDDVITCNTRSNTALFDELMAAGVPVVNAGDSKAPRNLHAAVMEGATFGLKLEESVLMNPNHSVVDDLPADVRGQLLR
ncbi:MAG TPA: FAD-dependent oxidoreductase [Candidatus Fournierella merdipullorum]|uniref:FAD-dependent oxidoreductase n=1 Tax=Candidatus Allofournierella merdipullorum TaxID=2838595 RepID=A0A9D2E3N4_9FIRM|nr:FAD-dependent oxidoreductase [Candidatus Fournierella merdipullorum]